MMRAHLTLAVLTLVVSCSSGSDPSGDIIDRSGRSAGTISAFGSVVVNGIAFETTNSIITVDDQAGQESDLLVGQTVVVFGSVDEGGGTGVADRIITEPNIRGPISAIDVTNSTLSVLAIEVSIVSATLFGDGILPDELDSLMVGDIVEVYGYGSSSGGVIASLVKRSTDTELEVRGRVANLDANAASFELGALTINYEAATLVGFSGSIANGDLVEAEGDVLNANVLQADRIELELATEFSAADENIEVELEGVVTLFVDAADFQIDGIRITTNSATEYEDGTQADLGVDIRIEVEGSIDANGVLVADEISFELENNLEAEAPVEAVDLVNQTIT
jgi:hypothetical protein